MKHYLICLAAILTFTNCTKQDLSLPNVTPGINTTEIGTRGLVDEKLITGKLLLTYTVTYTKSTILYSFKINCPEVKDPISKNYVWHPKWTYKTKLKAGVLSQTGGLELKDIKPIDFLSVNVETYCENMNTGIKSKVVSTGMVVKL